MRTGKAATDEEIANVHMIGTGDALHRAILQETSGL